MTPARAAPIFRLTAQTSAVAPVALCSLTVTRAIVFTDARCPGCNRKLMAIPGVVSVESRLVRTNDQRSGRGRVVSCRRCSSLVEIIEHRGAP